MKCEQIFKSSSFPDFHYNWIAMLVYFRKKSYRKWLPLKQRKDSTWGRHKVWRNCTCSSVQNYSADVVQCNAVKKSKVFVRFCRFQFKAFFFWKNSWERIHPQHVRGWKGGRKGCLKFRYCEKATKFDRNLPLCFEIT